MNSQDMKVSGGDFKNCDIAHKIVKNYRTEAEPLPPPFTAPKPPPQFVQRSEEFDALMELLVADGKQRTVAITTALQGGGGFGKTTLAQAICHDERIKEAFPDGILWVTIGDSPSLVELVNNQIRLLERNPLTYTDINAAAARLGVLLKGKKVLVVLDDVWRELDALNFVQKDSQTCAHLITTRQQEIACWLQAQAVTVNEMQTSQAVDLLIKWLAKTAAVEELATDEELRKQLHQLAEYLGEWPLLLELVVAQLRYLVQRRRKQLSQAIKDVRKRLKRRGFTAFDRTREQDRNLAISISLEVSLEELDASCEEKLGEGKKESWRQRYLELTIFPKDVDIPLTTIFKLWEGTAEFDDLEEAFYGIQSLSLFTRYDADKQTVRLHDVIRALITEQAKNLPDTSSVSTSLHSQFLSAYDLTNWADLPADDPYMWQHLTYHLRKAERNDDLRALLLDFGWMAAKLNATDINALLADYDKLPDDNVAEKIQRILRQASHILARDKKQLASQLWGRLPEDERAQLTSITPAGTWLRPLYPSLLSQSALVRTFKGHTDWVNGVAVTADGRRALSASKDKTVKVWDVATGEELLSFKEHTKSVIGVAVTADKRVLSASKDKTVKVWDLATGQEDLTFREHTDWVNGVAVTADGRRVLSASGDKTVKVWDLASGQEHLTFTGHTNFVKGVAVTADGRKALSVSSDQTLKVWDLATGEVLFSLAGHTDWVTGVAVTADGRWALSASKDKTVKVWDLATGQKHLTFTKHTDEVYGVAVTTDGRWALSASKDKTVKVWDLATGQVHKNLESHTEPVTGVAVTADERWALSASNDGTVKVWDLARLQERLSEAGHTESVNGVAVTADGRWALSASKDKTVKVWDLASGQEHLTFKGHTDEVTGVAVSERWAFSASEREVKVWDLATGQEDFTFKGHTDGVTGVAVTADGRWALSASDGEVKVWDLATGEERFSLAGHTSIVKGVAVTADECWALVASDREVKVWDLATGEERFSLANHTSIVRGVAVTADGRWGLCASDREVKVWDLASGQERFSFAGHASGVTGVAVTADGRWALSTSYDQTLKVWSLTNGRVLATFDAGEALYSCAVARDGVTIVVAGASGRLHFLRLEGGAVDILIQWLAGTTAVEGLATDEELMEQLNQLAEYLGQRPLLLELAGAQLRQLVQVKHFPLDEAIGKLRQALQEEGFDAFDREDDGQRNRAIHICLAVSLKRLGKWRERFMELAIFPEGTDIYHKTIFKLWSRKSRLKDEQAKKALQAMRKLSLFTLVDADKQTVRLHEVIRAYLVQQQAENLLDTSSVSTSLHSQFLSAYGLTNWAALPKDEPYLWHHLTYHLHEAECHSKLWALLLDFRWMEAKLNATNIEALLRDYDCLPDDEVVQRVGQTLRQAVPALAKDKSQLAGQLLGRLLADESTSIQSLLAQAHPAAPAIWLRPLTPSLQESSALIRPRKGHTDKVSGVAVTADGRWALSASYCEVKVWDLATGEEHHSFTDHTSIVKGVAVTADGRWALSASDGEVKVWDLASGQERFSLAGHTNLVTGVAVTADGCWALSASVDHTVKMWDLASGQERKNFAGHTDRVYGVAVTADGRWALSASKDKTVKVWDLASGQERFSFAGHTRQVNGVAVTADGRWALSASGRTVKVWNLASGQERLSFADHTRHRQVNGVAVTADGRWALSASSDQTLKVWSLTDGRVLTTFDAGEALYCCAVAPDGVTIVVAGKSGRLHFLRLEGVAVDIFIQRLAGTAAIEGLATFDTLMEQLNQLAQYLGEWPLLLDLVAAQLRRLVQQRRKPLSQAIQDVRKRLKRRGFTAFDRTREQDRNVAISISLEASFEELDASCKEKLGEDKKESWRQRYLELAIFPKNVDIPLTTIFKLWKGTAEFDELESKEALVGMQSLSFFTPVGADKQSVGLHNVIRAYLVEQQAENLPDTSSVILHGQFLDAYGLTNWATLPEDDLYLWHHLTYHLHEAKRHSKLWALLLDFGWMEAKLNATNIQSLLRDYDCLPDDEVVQQVGQTLRQAEPALAKDKSQLAGQLLGRLLADKSTPIQSLLAQALSAAPAIWLRPLTPSLQESSALICHTKSVNGVAVTADGRWALSASKDKTVKVWDLATGQEHFSFAGHSSKVNGVAVTADGRWVLSASSDKTVKVWDLATGQEHLWNEHRFASFADHSSKVNGVAVTADGRWALSASSDKTVKVWDLATGQERFWNEHRFASFAGHTKSVTGVAVTADGRWALSASKDKTVKVWDLASGQECLSLAGHASGVNGVAVTADGRWALSASSDKTVKVWDLASGQERFFLAGHTKSVTGVAVTADGRWALSASDDETVKVWSLTDGRVLATFYAGEALYSCAMTPDGVTIVAAGESGRLHFLRLEGVAVDIFIQRLAGTAAVEGLATFDTLMKQLNQLAEYLGEWPLLLDLVAAQLCRLVQQRRKPLSQAIQDVRKRLTRRGFTAFDRTREQDRNLVISISLEISLEELDASCEEKLGEDKKESWRQRYLELAIFPKDVDIPLTTIFKLWEGTAEFDDLESKEALEGMQSLSLFTRDDFDAQSVRLYDVIRAYLVEQQAEHLPDTSSVILHRQFLDAYGLTNWATLPKDEIYLWHHFTYHLHEAERHSKLRALLLDFGWMEAKLNATNILALLSDYDCLPDDEIVQRVGRTLRQAVHVLAKDKSQLAEQLVERLLADKSTPIQSLLAQALPAASGICLRPQESSALHTEEVTGVAVTADGRLAISASFDETLKGWDIESGQERHKFDTDLVTGVAVTADGRWALSASDCEVKVWDLATSQKHFSFAGHTYDVNGVAVTADGRWALSVSYREVKVWDLATGQKRQNLVGHIYDVNKVAVTADGRWALSASDHEVKVWDLATGQERLWNEHPLASHTDRITGVAVTADGRWALVASGNRVKVWDLASGQEGKNFAGHTDEVTGVAVTADGDYALSVSKDKTVKVWSPTNGRFLAMFDAGEVLTCCAMTPDGVTIVAAGESGRLHFLRLEEIEEDYGSAIKDGHILQLTIQEEQTVSNQQQPSYGGINIGNNAQIGEVYTGGKRQINTGGGSYFEGDVNTGGGNLAGSNQTNVDNITGSIVIGDHAQVTVNQGSGNHDELAKQFAQMYKPSTKESIEEESASIQVTGGIKMLGAHLQRRFVQALMAVPATSRREGRDGLLAGLPPNVVAGLNRTNNTLTDLRNIVTQLKGLGRLLATGEWPLILVAENAMMMVAGVEAEKKIQAVMTELEAHYRPVVEERLLIATPAKKPASAVVALSVGDKMALVEDLLAIPTMSKRDNRMQVLAELRDEIKSSIDYKPTDKLHLLSVVTTCANYPDGLEELRYILQLLEGHSGPMQRFETSLACLLAKG